MALLPPLKAYVERALSLAQTLPRDRTKKLEVLGRYLDTQKRLGEAIQLNFICTHNSRRSHFGQLWAAASAHYHKVSGVSTFSGGVKATAFNPRAVAALERAGFSVVAGEGDNPRYRVRFSDDVAEAVCFSKLFDDETNPKSNFAAVMTCTEADQNCPVILGATRISLPYLDPKEADDTPQEAERYDERCLQIASEMLWVFRQVARKLE